MPMSRSKKLLLTLDVRAGAIARLSGLSESARPRSCRTPRSRSHCTSKSSSVPVVHSKRLSRRTLIYANSCRTADVEASRMPPEIVTAGRVQSSAIPQEREAQVQNHLVMYQRNAKVRPKLWPASFPPVLPSHLLFSHLRERNTRRALLITDMALLILSILDFRLPCITLSLPWLACLFEI